MSYDFIDKHEAYRTCGFSESRLKLLRRDSRFQSGIHYYKLGPQSYCYNKQLLQNLAIHGMDLDCVAHQQAIKQFKRSLAYGLSSSRAS